MESPALSAKITCLALFALVTLLCGLLPLLLSRLARRCSSRVLPGKNQWRKRSELLVSSIMCLGSGVLIATVFTHMLPEIRELFEEAERHDLLPEVGVPMGEMFLCIGFFMVFLIEEVAHACMSHGHHRKHHKSRKNQGAERGLDNPGADVASEEGGNETPSEDSHSHDGEHRDHDHAADIVSQKSFRAYLVVIALSVHSIFEGLAVGLEESPRQVWLLFSALIAHKVIVAFCIGQQLLGTKRSSCFIVSTFSIFAFASPLGVGIGITIIDGTMGGGSVLATGILQSLAAGTILYVVFFELLGPEMQKRRWGIVKCVAALVGFGIMLLIHLTGGHAHSHGGHAGEVDTHQHGHHGHGHGDHGGANHLHGDAASELPENVIRDVEERVNLDGVLQHHHQHYDEPSSSKGSGHAHSHVEVRHHQSQHHHTDPHPGDKHSNHRVIPYFTAHSDHDHSDHDHSEHDHSEHDHSKHDHSEHDHSEPNQSKHDHSEPNPAEDNHSKHDHSDHDHFKHDHSKHDHPEPGHSKHDHIEPNHAEHDHSKHDHSEPNQSEHGHSEHDHSTYDHSENYHSEPNHSEHDHSKHGSSRHDHSEHDHSEHDHSKHDNSEPNQSEHDHSGHDDFKNDQSEHDHPEPGHSKHSHTEPNHTKQDNSKHENSEPNKSEHDHSEHDHSEHHHSENDDSEPNHTEHDSSKHDHSKHDRPEQDDSKNEHSKHDHPEPNQSEHDNSEHYHSEQDNSERNHSVHDHSEHDEIQHDHKKQMNDKPAEVIKSRHEHLNDSMLADNEHNHTSLWGNELNEYTGVSDHPDAGPTTSHSEHEHLDMEPGSHAAREQPEHGHPAREIPAQTSSHNSEKSYHTDLIKTDDPPEQASHNATTSAKPDGKVHTDHDHSGHNSTQGKTHENAR